MTACDECRMGKQTREHQYHCSNPKFRGGKKVIYPETFKVLKVIGCGGAQVFSVTPDHLQECNAFNDEDGPQFCNDRGERCRYKNRKNCPDYVSVIDHQVERDKIQGTNFAERMRKDAAALKDHQEHHDGVGVRQ